MFDKSCKTQCTRPHLDINSYNFEDKENFNHFDENIKEFSTTDNPTHTPIIYINKKDKEISSFKRNLNSTDITCFNNSSNYSDFKFYPNKSTSHNPFHKLDLDNYIRNFTSPRKNNDEETLCGNKRNVGFAQLFQISSAKNKPKLTQSESRQVSLLISKQKNAILKKITNISSKNLENQSEINISNNNSSINSLMNVNNNSYEDNSTKYNLKESEINSRQCSITIKSIFKECSNITDTPYSFISDTAVFNHPLSCSSFDSRISNTNSVKNDNKGLVNHSLNMDKKINQISECQNEIEESLNTQPHQKDNDNNKYNASDIFHNEADKHLLITKEKRNDEIYKLLKVKKIVRKPEVSVNSSARKITDLKKYDDECPIDDGKIFYIIINILD